MSTRINALVAKQTDRHNHNVHQAHLYVIIRPKRDYSRVGYKYHSKTYLLIKLIMVFNIINHHLGGKSAILTALIVGLGGKATTTSRAASLKSFVKYGERWVSYFKDIFLNSPPKEPSYFMLYYHSISSSAEVTVKLRNRGSDAYKGDVYEDYISIEQRITSDGCRTCKIKNKSGNEKCWSFAYQYPFL